MNTIKKIAMNVPVYVGFFALLAFQIYKLFVEGGYNYAVHLETVHSMWLEIIIFAVVMMAINNVIKGKWKIVLGIAVIVVMSYLHQTILPLLVAFVYLGLILLSGALFASLIFRNKVMDTSIYWISSLMLGINFIMLFTALLSAIHCFSEIIIWITLIVLSIGSMICMNRKLYCQLPLIEKGYQFNWFLTFFEISMLIQVGRVNIQADYDSVWYGLRSSSDFVNSSAGIYEDLKLVGLTYLYPKGFETILLPLCKFDSWSYRFLFNTLLAAIIVLVCYLWVKELTDAKIACMIGMVVCTIPSMLNMAVTVKSDIITVLFQIAAIYIVYLAQRRKNMVYVYISLAFIISSYCFKVTSLLFSSALLIALLPFVNFKKWKWDISGLSCVFSSVLSICAIWGRTLYLTGSPLIVYVGGILDKLGIATKYPYDVVRGFQGEGVALQIVPLLDKVMKHLYGYFVLPEGTEYNHVIIAWGTSIPAIVFVLALCIFVLKKQSIKKSFKWVWFMGIQLLSVLGGLAAIGQADGNYFMLAYIIFVAVGGSYVLKYYKSMMFLLYASTIFNVVICSFTNWSWVYGFSERKLCNKGYVSQEKICKEQYIKNNGEVIYNIVNKNKKSKMIALSGDMSCLISLDCVSQYWFDLYYRPAFISSVDEMEKYIQTCGFDYIYIEAPYLVKDSLEENLFFALIDNGVVKDVVCENTNILLMTGENVECKNRDELKEKIDLLLKNVRNEN